MWGLLKAAPIPWPPISFVNTRLIQEDRITVTSPRFNLGTPMAALHAAQ